ncbi:hypothetical protein BASA60_004234 [Batrachochytrium salamandrivorans]|nr:hypothetical protein BASA60_004234 [Batrachochytrium salamandrivorans]
MGVLPPNHRRWQSNFRTALAGIQERCEEAGRDRLYYGLSGFSRDLCLPWWWRAPPYAQLGFQPQHPSDSGTTALASNASVLAMYAIHFGSSIDRSTITTHRQPMSITPLCTRCRQPQCDVQHPRQ